MSKAKIYLKELSEQFKRTQKALQAWSQADTPNIAFDGGVVKGISESLRLEWQRLIDASADDGREVEDKAKRVVMALDDFALKFARWMRAAAVQADKGFRFQTFSGNAIISTDSVGDGSFSEKFRFSNDGQLGIGTNAPGASVHIVRSDLGACLWMRHTGPTNAAIFLDAAGPNTVDRPVLVMRKNTDNCYVLSCDGLSIGTVYHEVPGVNGRHIFLTNGLERIRIDTTGIKSAGHIAGGYSLLGANSTSMPFASVTVVQLPVSAPLTLTSTVPAAGTICFLIIETQGTNTRTVNFNPFHFFVTGPVNTGAVAGKTFTLTFISNGNRLIETGRAGPAG